MSLPGYNTSVWTENCWVGYEPPTSAPLYSVVGHRNRVPLEEIEPPFVYLEDEKGGPCPYGWSVSNREYEEWDCASFFRDFGRKSQRALRAKYREGVYRSAQVFENRLRVIDRRGLADTTLVLFLSDHGESLGEHGGIVGHDFTTPEVAYVPVVFIHPDLPRGTNFEAEGVLRLIDLYPTILDLLGYPATGPIDGVDLLSERHLPTHGLMYQESNVERKGLRFDVREVSVWDRNGGYMFRQGPSILLLLARALYLAVLGGDSLTAIYLRQRLRTSPTRLKEYRKVLSCLCAYFMKWGAPSFGAEEARLRIQKAYRSRTREEQTVHETRRTEDQELVEARLRALGYID
jgi:hypothetical protein